MSDIPRTLREAIQNGITEGVGRAANHEILKMNEVVERHVLEYLRQGFGALYLELDDTLDYRALAKTRALARRFGIER